MLDSLKPAQLIHLTVTKTPRREDDEQTIARLMRLDPDIKAGLRRTQRHRGRATPTKIRGGRVWTKRMKRTMVARVEPGATWSMAYIPQIRNDLASVAEFLTIKSA